MAKRIPPLTVVVMLVCMGLASQPLGAQRGTDSLTLTKRVASILEAMFPDAGAQMLTLRIFANGEGPNVVYFQAWETWDEPPTQGNGRETSPRYWLSGNAEFDDRGLLLMSITGRVVRDDMRRNRDMSLQEVASHLESTGAKYPPKAGEAFEAWLRHLDFAPLVGKALILSAKFEPEHVGWGVALKGADGSVFDLFFEPYGGHLVSLHRLDKR